MIKSLKKFLLNPWFQLAFSVLCVTASEVFLKRGAVEAPKLPKELNWTGVSGLASANVWFGILFVNRSFDCRKTSRADGGEIVTIASALLISFALVLFVAAQLLFKHAMESKLYS